MGNVCTEPGFHLSPYRKDSVLIYAQEDLFSTLYTMSERVLNETPKSEVRLCRRNSSEKIYVLKKIPSSQQMSLEAKILRTLDHPNIIKLIQCFSHKYQNYLVLEYLQHGDLAQYLKKTHKLSESIASSIIFQVSQALFYIHQKGIYHRDVKPENIFLRSIKKKTIKCKLADFDCADFISSKETRPHGTLPYMAPEVFSHHYDSKVDTWSLGVVLYRILTGHLPFIAISPNDLEHQIKCSAICYPSYLSPLAQDLLAKLLERNKYRRFSAFQVLQHEWIRLHNEHLIEEESPINGSIHFKSRTPTSLKLKEFIF